MWSDPFHPFLLVCLQNDAKMQRIFFGRWWGYPHFFQFLNWKFSDLFFFLFDPFPKERTLQWKSPLLIFLNLPWFIGSITTTDLTVTFQWGSLTDWWWCWRYSAVHNYYWKLEFYQIFWKTFLQSFQLNIQLFE